MGRAVRRGDRQAHRRQVRDSRSPLLVRPRPARRDDRRIDTDRGPVLKGRAERPGCPDLLGPDLREHRGTAAAAARAATTGVFPLPRAWSRARWRSTTGPSSSATGWVQVDGWVGSQNHNWGRRHTDHYAFGQVAGFDDAPDTFLEVVSAKVKVGPVRLPMVTCLSLRHRGRTHELVSLLKGMRARCRVRLFLLAVQHRQ